jgi:hypothetical protein
MKKALVAAAAVAVVAAPVLVLAFAPAPDAGSHPVEHKLCNGYAESRDTGLKGDFSFLALTSKTEFSRIFAPVLTPRGAPDPVAKDAFDTRLFVAVIKRGDVLWDYKVEKVTANGDTLTVNYAATPRKGGAAQGKATKRAPDSTSTSKGVTEKARATEKADAPKATARAAPSTEAAPVRATEKKPYTSKAEPTTQRVRDGSASFDSPLILSVPKDKYLTVVFIENGKKVGTARVGN